MIITLFEDNNVENLWRDELRLWRQGHGLEEARRNHRSNQSLCAAVVISPCEDCAGVRWTLSGQEFDDRRYVCAVYPALDDSVAVNHNSGWQSNHFVEGYHIYSLLEAEK